MNKEEKEFVVWGAVRSIWDLESGVDHFMELYDHIPKREKKKILEKIARHIEKRPEFYSASRIEAVEELLENL